MEAALPEDPLPPWLLAPRASLLQRARAGQLPTGLLLHGSSGMGKSALTGNLLQSLLCAHASGTNPPCGECNACRSLLGGVHPEVMTLTPEEEGKEILIGAAREAIDFVALSGAGALRTVVIRPAESLTASAANALLKTLEEPPPGVMLLLEAAQPGRLPATIRSRCQMLEVPAPAAGEAIDWLRRIADPAEVDEAYAASLGRPFTALEILVDPERKKRWEQDREALGTLLQAAGVTHLARALQGSLPESLIPRLQALLVSAQRLLITGEVDTFGRQFPRASLQAFAAHRGARRLARLSMQALVWQRQASHPLNPQLRMEDIALELLGDGSSNG